MKSNSKTHPLQKHVENFAEAVNHDPELAGVVMQLTYSRPEGASEYVTGIVIGDSSQDAQSAVAALSPVGEPRFGALISHWLDTPSSPPE